jgi:hypothetical protein
MAAADLEHEPAKGQGPDRDRQHGTPVGATATAPVFGQVEGGAPGRTAEQILSLQRTIGNQAVARLLNRAPSDSGAREPRLRRRLELVNAEAWDGEKLLVLFRQKKEIFSKEDEKVIDGGSFNAPLITDALGRMTLSDFEYGKFDPAADQHLLLLFHEIQKHLTMPKKAIAPGEEVDVSKKQAEAEATSLRDYKNLSPDPSEGKAATFDLAFLGAGAATAYYLTTMGGGGLPGDTIVIGELQPWAGDRGPGVINHPMHMITALRNEVGLAEEALAPRGAFSEMVELVIKKYVPENRRTNKVKNVTKVPGTGGGAMFYRIEVDGPEPKLYYARRVVAGLGIGPHKAPAGQKDLKVASEGRAMNMDQFQNTAGKIKLLKEKPSDITVVVSGGNAAIDSVMTAIDNKFTIIWVTGTSRPALLPGTDNETVEENYDKLEDDGKPREPGEPENFVAPEGVESKIQRVVKGYAVNAVANPKPATESYIPKPILVNITDGKPIEADYFVYAMGPDVEKVRGVFDKASVQEKLVPTYDKNRQFGSEGRATVIGLEVPKDSASDKSSLEIIGGTALRIGDKVPYDYLLEQWRLVARTTTHMAGLKGSFSHWSGKDRKLEVALDAMQSSYQKATEFESAALDAVIWAKMATAKEALRKPAEPAFADEVNSMGIPLEGRPKKFRDRYLSDLRFIESYATMLTKYVADIEEHFEKKASDPKYRGADPRTAAGEMGGVIDSLPLNVAVNDQLTPVRSQIESGQAFVPDYVMDDANFATDSNTVLALFVSSRYPYLADAEVDMWVDRIVRWRRPTTEDRKTYETLHGPIPNPNRKPRENAKSFSDWFKRRLGEENGLAKERKGIK